MMDQIKELAAALELRMSSAAAAAIDGVPAELGTITATGLKLDNFKHELTDFLVADWLAQLHFPALSFVGTMASPVDENGKGGSPSQLTRFDMQPMQVKDVRLNLKDNLQTGDRVLAVPVNAGRDVVVLCRVVDR